MKWLKRDAWHIDSACGRFRINKACNPPVYQAVRIVPPPPVIVRGRCESLAEAKQSCEGRE